MANWLSLAPQVVRSLGRAPSFFAGAVGSLAFGVAIVTVIATLAAGIYLNPLPFAKAERLVAISQERSAGWGPFSLVDSSAITGILRYGRSFDRLSVYRFGDGSLRDDASTRLRALFVDSGFVNLFELRAQFGRLIDAQDVMSGSRSAMISDELWRRRFGADSGVLGSPIDVGGIEHHVVGVLPPGFAFPLRTAVFAPAPVPGAQGGWSAAAVAARLKPGITRAQARGDLAILGQFLPAEDRPGSLGVRLILRDDVVNRAILPSPAIFLATALLVLLVACSNVGTLMLTRFTQRHGELAIRSALGATRGDLAAIVMMESAVVALVGCACGATLGTWLASLTIRFLPVYLPSWIRLDVSGATIAGLGAVWLIVAALVGLAASRHATSTTSLNSVMSGAGRGISLNRRRIRRGPFIQTVVGTVFVVVSVLLVRSQLAVKQFDFGYPAERIVTMSVRPPQFGLQPLEFQRRLELALEEISHHSPAMSIAVRGAYVGSAAMGLGGDVDDRIHVIDRSGTKRSPPAAQLLVVSSGYFDLMGQSVRRGRVFHPADVTAREKMAVVSHRFADLAWPGIDPIGAGQHVEISGVKYNVIGVTEDVMDLQRTPSGVRLVPRAEVFLSTKDAKLARPEVLVTGSGNPVALGRSVGARLRATNTAVSESQPRLLSDQTAELTFIQRALASVVMACGVAAAALVLLGVFAVTAYSVESRVDEIAIRLALGASPGQVGRLVYMEALGTVGTGVVVGALVAIALAKLLSAVLVGVSAVDAASLIVASAVFAVIAILAAHIPARRAMRTSSLSIIMAR